MSRCLSSSKSTDPSRSTAQEEPQPGQQVGTARWRTPGQRLETAAEHSAICAFLCVYCKSASGFTVCSLGLLLTRCYFCPALAAGARRAVLKAACPLCSGGSWLCMTDFVFLLFFKHLANVSKETSICLAHLIIQESRELLQRVIWVIWVRNIFRYHLPS